MVLRPRERYRRPEELAGEAAAATHVPGGTEPVGPVPSRLCWLVQALVGGGRVRRYLRDGSPVDELAQEFREAVAARVGGGEVGSVQAAADELPSR